MITWPRFEGRKAINVLRIASAGIHAQTVTIGADVYELTTKDSLAVGTVGHIPVDVHAGATVKAQGKYTVAGGDAADTETLIINGKTYILQTTLTNVDGHVKIGTTPEGTIDNMVAAINGAAGAGSTYALATIPHTTVVASKSSTDKLVLTAIIGGTPGNAYTLAGTAAHWTRDAATLGTLTLGVDPSATNVTDALLAAINGATLPTELVEASKIGNNELLVRATAIGAMVLACAETLLGTNNGWANTTMFDGSTTVHRRMARSVRVPKAVEVALGNLHYELSFTPSFALVFVGPTATPFALKIFDGAITISGGHVTVDNAGSTDWAETDTVEALFFE